MQRCLVYNFVGDVDEISVLFPYERLGVMAGILLGRGVEAVVWDRANFRDLQEVGAPFITELASLEYAGTSEAYRRGVEAEADRVAAGGFDAALLHLWSGTGFKFSMDLAAALKRRAPGLTLLGIGQKVDWYGEHILRLEGSALDGLLTGLGYAGVDALARGEEFERVPGLVWRDGASIRTNAAPVIHVDDYPGPVYDPAVYRGIESKVPVYPVTLSNQACPNACNFCVRTPHYGTEVRRRAVATVLAEMESAWRERGARCFRVEDSTPPPGALTALARAILESPLKGQVQLSAFARVDQNAAEDFALLKQAGFCSLFFGIESLDPAVLRDLGKGFTVEAVRPTLAAAHAAGLFTVGSFIFPTPGETEASMERTLAGIESLKDVLGAVLVVPAGVHPPTAWARDPARYGIRLGPRYVEEAIVYPIKYLVPLDMWKPLPYSYRLMGREPQDVTWADIVAVHNRFVQRVRRDIGLPGVPDYYVLVARLMGAPPPEAARRVVDGMIRRDYAALGAAFGLPPT